MLPVLILVSGYFLSTGRLFYSLLALLAVVASMETRVRMGYRGKRSWLFVTHLSCSALFIFSLIVFWLRLHSWMFPIAEAAFVGIALTGLFLVKGSWNRLY